MIHMFPFTYLMLFFLALPFASFLFVFAVSYKLIRYLKFFLFKNYLKLSDSDAQKISQNLVNNLNLCIIFLFLGITYLYFCCKQNLTGVLNFSYSQLLANKYSPACSLFAIGVMPLWSIIASDSYTFLDHLVMLWIASFYYFIGCFLIEFFTLQRVIKKQFFLLTVASSFITAAIFAVTYTLIMLLLIPFNR